MVNKNKEQETILAIFLIWNENEKQTLLTFQQIIKRGKEFALSRRTIIRYINKLVSKGKLKKDERSYKKTFYVPTQKFFEEIECYNKNAILKNILLKINAKINLSMAILKNLENEDVKSWDKTEWKEHSLDG